MVAYRRGGAFCKGIVNTARRRGLPFAPAKGSKTGQRGTKLSPLQTPLTLSCAGYEYCFSLNNREKQIRTAHRCAPKVARGAFYVSSCRNQIKNQPYKRRLIPLRETVALAFRAGQKGSPQGRKTLWGEEDAPQRGGLPKVKHRVSPTQAEIASDERTGL